jgi:hypothetical protein
MDQVSGDFSYRPVSELRWPTIPPAAAASTSRPGPTLRRQVLAIIGDILNDQRPERAEVRVRLRKHLARNPGHPEQGLLEHLMERHAPEYVAGADPTWPVDGLRGWDEDVVEN